MANGIYAHHPFQDGIDIEILQQHFLVQIFYQEERITSIGRLSLISNSGLRYDATRLSTLLREPNITTCEASTHIVDVCEQLSADPVREQAVHTYYCAKHDAVNTDLPGLVHRWYPCCRAWTHGKGSCVSKADE